MFASASNCREKLIKVHPASIGFDGAFVAPRSTARE